MAAGVHYSANVQLSSFQQREKLRASEKKHTREAITTVSARQNFSDLINRVAYGKDRIVLTRRNRPLAAVVPIEDIALLEDIEDRDDLKAARAALREVKRKGTIPWTVIKKELGLD